MLEAQLNAANREGRAVVQQLEAEKAKSQHVAQFQQHVVASTSRVNVPNVPSFKGEVGFTVDVWLRRLIKHFEFYGVASFPDAASRIKYAIMFLDGPATDWWDNLPADDKLRIVTWDAFVESLHARFRPLQASLVARHRLSGLKQTHSVAAYATLFQKELTPISDMSDADQIHYFRSGLKSFIGQRVLEKTPKTLHEAIDIAILADAYGVGKLNTSLYRGNNSYRAQASKFNKDDNSMDLSMLDHGDQSNDEVESSGPVFHGEEESPSSSSAVSKSQISSLMREFNKMKNEVKKFQTQSSISALGASAASSSSSSSGGGRTRVPVSKEEFEHCWSNRLCLKCKKPGHIARDCRSTMQNLKH
jgi:hypothetical protein